MIVSLVNLLLSPRVTSDFLIYSAWGTYVIFLSIAVSNLAFPLFICSAYFNGEEEVLRISFIGVKLLKETIDFLSSIA